MKLSISPFLLIIAGVATLAKADYYDGDTFDVVRGIMDATFGKDNCDLELASGGPDAGAYYSCEFWGTNEPNAELSAIEIVGKKEIVYKPTSLRVCKRGNRGCKTLKFREFNVGADIRGARNLIESLGLQGSNNRSLRSKTYYSYAFDTVHDMMEQAFGHQNCYIEEGGGRYPSTDVFCESSSGKKAHLRGAGEVDPSPDTLRVCNRKGCRSLKFRGDDETDIRRAKSLIKTLGLRS